MTNETTTEEARTPGQSLDLRDLHAANIARQAEWCPDQVPDLSFRGNELGGECGEAQNVIKKLERERQGWRGSRATKDDLADELADVVICADLCAVTADIDLGAAVLRKFNATSEKQGLSVFLPSATPRADSAERTTGEDDPDVAYQRGKEDGYSEGVLDAAARAGLTLEYGASSDPERHVPGPAEMLLRIAEHTDALSPSAPAPSSPGVPDSVRALSEAASEDWATNDATPYILGPQIDGEHDRFEVIARGPHGHAKSGDAIRKWQANRMFAVAAVNFVRTLISAHPAGQSTGQGAWAEHSPQEIVRRTRCMADETRDAVVWRDCCDLILERLGKPAPDSTRTGPVGAEEVEKLAWIILANLRTDVSVADLRRKLDEEQSGKFGLSRSWCQALDTARRQARAILAARPAAPEAQGAWSFDMEAAPRDGTSVLVAGPSLSDPNATFVGEAYIDADNGGHWWWAGTSYGDYHAGPLHETGFKPYAWHPMLDAPAPPASSGQESA